METTLKKIRWFLGEDRLDGLETRIYLQMDFIRVQWSLEIEQIDSWATESKDRSGSNSFVLDKETALTLLATSKEMDFTHLAELK